MKLPNPNSSLLFTFLGEFLARRGNVCAMCDTDSNINKHYRKMTLLATWYCQESERQLITSPTLCHFHNRCVLITLIVESYTFARFPLALWLYFEGNWVAVSYLMLTTSSRFKPRYRTCDGIRKTSPLVSRLHRSLHKTFFDFETLASDKRSFSSNIFLSLELTIEQESKVERDVAP